MTDISSTMGIFPIIMNILQFWLIDSIVKASNAIALDGNSSSNLGDSEHHEPLFNVPSDDEDDGAYKPGDLENQSRNRPSSFSLDDQRGKSSNVDEYKSSSASTTYDDHSYPPSLSSSMAFVAPSGNDHVKTIKTAKNLMKKQRRERPPPLLIEPAGRPTIDSSRVIAPLTVVPGPKPPERQSVEAFPPTMAQQRSTQGATTVWTDSWDDAEDWAAHTGEGEQTGRRLEDKRQVLK